MQDPNTDMGAAGSDGTPCEPLHQTSNKRSDAAQSTFWSPQFGYLKVADLVRPPLRPEGNNKSSLSGSGSPLFEGRHGTAAKSPVTAVRSKAVHVFAAVACVSAAVLIATAGLLHNPGVSSGGTSSPLDFVSNTMEELRRQSYPVVLRLLDALDSAQAYSARLFRGPEERHRAGSSSAFMKTLKGQFRGQKTRFFAILSAVFKAAQTDVRPLAIMLMNNDANGTADLSLQRMALCLANYFENLLTGRQALLIDGESYRSLDPDDSKQRMYDLVESHLSSGRVVVITNIESLVKKHTGIFYAYCSPEASLHKNSVFVTTLNVHGSPSAESIEQTLLTSWNVTTNELYQIMARIANNILVVENTSLHDFRCTLQHA